MPEYMDEGRLMALDYGHKRVGVAFSDPFRSYSLPDSAIINTPELIPNLMKTVREKNVTHIVVGLPLHMNGTDTPQTTLTRVFAQQLAKQGVPVSLCDERMSSKAVDRQMLAADASRKTRKANVDSQAAAFILQGFLDKLAMMKTKGQRPEILTPLEETHDDL